MTPPTTNIQRKLELHKLTTELYWTLREAGLSNEESEVQVARYKSWYCQAKGWTSLGY